MLCKPLPPNNFMKGQVFMLTLVLLAGAPGCDQNDNDYVKTFKGDVIQREDAQYSRPKNGPEADNVKWNEKETPGQDKEDED